MSNISSAPAKSIDALRRELRNTSAKLYTNEHLTDEQIMTIIVRKDELAREICDLRKLSHTASQSQNGHAQTIKMGKTFSRDPELVSTFKDKGIIIQLRT